MAIRPFLENFWLLQKILSGKNVSQRGVGGGKIWVLVRGGWQVNKGMVRGGCQILGVRGGDPPFPPPPLCIDFSKSCGSALQYYFKEIK